MNSLVLMALAASLAVSSSAPAKFVEVKSIPLMIPLGKAAADLVPESLTRGEGDLWVELRGVVRPDGRVDLQCAPTHSHDFRRGLPR